MKTVLVTGSLGFCGLHLSHQLKKRGAKVFGTFHQDKSSVKGIPWTLLKLDVRSRGEVHQLIRRTQPDEIYHLAGQTAVGLSWKNPEMTFEANVYGLINLLDAMRLYCPKGKLLFPSTAHVYGYRFLSRRPVKETDLAWPVSPYGASKRVGELACLDFYRAFKVKSIIVRAFNHIGTGQSPNFVLSDWCRQIAAIEAKKQAPLIRVGHLNVRRDFLNVRDVVEAYQVLMKQGRIGEIYNLCSERSIPLKQYLTYLLKKAGVRIRVITKRQKFRRFDPPVISGSSHKMRHYRWKPKFSIYQALDEMLESWRLAYQKELARGPR